MSLHALGGVSGGNLSPQFYEEDQKIPSLQDLRLIRIKGKKEEGWDRGKDGRLKWVIPFFNAAHVSSWKLFLLTYISWFSSSNTGCPFSCPKSLQRFLVVSFYTCFPGGLLQPDDFQFDVWADNSLIRTSCPRLSCKLQPHISHCLPSTRTRRSNRCIKFFLFIACTPSDHHSGRFLRLPVLSHSPHLFCWETLLVHLQTWIWWLSTSPTAKPIQRLSLSALSLFSAQKTDWSC